MKRFLAEFIGTFFLVFTIGGAVASGSTLAPLAIGAILTVMVFAGGHISGAHYNPAVSLAMVIRRKMKISEMFFYWTAQLMGGFLGALTSHVITGKNESTVMEPALNITSSMPLLAELLGTFALTYVVLNVATAKDNAGNSFYGLAIGFTVVAMAVAIGGISGGAFNPAVGIGRSVANLVIGSGTSIGNAWIYIIGPLAGATLAAYTFKYLYAGDD
ncbi:MAG: aquaporin family protein [Chitinophagales bacterium]|nr:aquaporin family protein [Chitinophagales bacterium]